MDNIEPQNYVNARAITKPQIKQKKNNKKFNLICAWKIVKTWAWPRSMKHLL